MHAGECMCVEEGEGVYVTLIHVQLLEIYSVELSYVC